MKKVLIGTLGVLAIVAVAGYLFREPLLKAVAERLTADMFIAADTDDFDPGIPVGSQMPDINARYDGRTVQDLAEFQGDNGLVLFANRSVDW